MFLEVCFFPNSVNKPAIVRDAVALCGAGARSVFLPGLHQEWKGQGFGVGVDWAEKLILFLLLFLRQTLGQKRCNKYGPVFVFS